MSLVQAFEALKRKDGAGALTALEGETSVRATSYRAQALQLLGRLEQAERVAAQAVRQAKGDDEALRAVRELHASILASLAAKRAAGQGQALDAGLCDAPEGGSEGAAWRLRKACALAEAGRADEAAELARRVGGAARERVLASLLRARLGELEAIHEAHAVADASDDMNLVTAVAQAARAAGIRLVTPAFGVAGGSKPTGR